MSSSTEYWSTRLADKVYEHSTHEMERVLKKLYKQQSNSIRAMVIELYAELLTEGELSSTALYQYGRYQQLLSRIAVITKYSAERQITILEDTLNKVYHEAFEKTCVAQGATVWGLQNTFVVEEVVNAKFKGKNFSKRIWDSRDKLVKALEKEIVNVVISGQSKDSAVKIIQSTTNNSFHNADRLVRSETMRVINDGQVQSFIANGRTHGYYIVAHDDRLCDMCNEISRKSRASPMRLQDMEAIHHPNCRCTIRPIVGAINKNRGGNENG